MGALGVVEIIGADAAFLPESMKPVAPGTEQTSSDVASRAVRPRIGAEELAESVRASLEVSVASARVAAAEHRSSTTLASLSHALESVGDREGSVAAANEALDLLAANGIATDRLGARLAFEVLLRAGEIDYVLRYAKREEIPQQLKLVLGAFLAVEDRGDEALDFVNQVDVPGADAVIGFVRVVHGDYHAAIAHLRAALRDEPSDANSALNLSIALWAIGARRKAITAALQAKLAAPGRADIGLHYMELLLAERMYDRVVREVSELADAGVEASSRLLIVHARAELGAGRADKGMQLLEQASRVATAEGDKDTIAEVRSNIIRMRAARGRMRREDAIDQLLKMHAEFPSSAVVVLNLAQVTNRASHVPSLRAAVEQVRGALPAQQTAFLQYQLSMLEGNNDVSVENAREWLRLDPDNVYAASAVLVAVGIGQEQWKEAAAIAHALASRPEGPGQELNNTAYVLAMAGKADEAIELLEPHATSSFVMKATLGLAHLVKGEIQVGMKLYRDAAAEAERLHDDSRSLMTAYQALIVRQLRIAESVDPVMVTALSLPPYPLPEDWEDRPEFLRLYAIAKRDGYDWPLSI